MTQTSDATGELLFSFDIQLAPVPASRPRVSKWGTYYLKTYADWKSAAAGFMPAPPATPATGELAVTLLMVCKRPKKLTQPIPNGDIDNFSKAALDAVNDAGLWGDDKQVVSLHATKRYAEPGEQPKTHIEIRSMTCETLHD